MTLTEKILARHAGKERVEPGELILAKVDLALGNDVTSPIAIDAVRGMGVKAVFDREKIALVPDHFAPNKDIKSAEQMKMMREFAREYARQRFERSPRSALSVTVELESRGVGRVDAELAVAGTMQDEGLTDESLAERAARKKMAALGDNPSDERTRSKVFAFLASRGFSREVARRIVLDVLERQ